MSESVCLQCGSEMQYDWAPCPKCGWRQPGEWEPSSEEAEEGAPASRHAVLSSPKKWIAATAWTVLAVLLAGIILYLFH